MTALAGIPIGEGQARTRWRPLEQAELPDEESFVQPPPPTPLVEAPSVEVIVWDEHRLRQPLRLVGKTVNWQVRRRSGLAETEAGLMTEENLQEIGEPLAEVLNRYEPVRALAARSAELNLALAVWDYAHQTAHVAARDRLLAEQGARRAAPGQEALSHLAIDDGEVPEL